MKTLRAMFIRFVGLFRRKRHEAEMNDELRVHLDALIERNVAAGMSPDEARFAALREFGGVEQIKESARDERRSVWLESFFRDLRYAAQALRKSPAFTLAAVLTLALGIGVNAALFTFYNAIALRPLPVQGPDELVILRRPGSSPRRVSYPDYLAYRDGNRSFTHLAGWLDTPMPLFAADGAPVDPTFEVRGRGIGLTRGWVAVQAVTENYFATLGAQLAHGRSFLPEESRAPGGPLVIVLQHRFWETWFHRDPHVLGKTVVLAGRPHVVIGVTAEGFVGHQPAPPIGWVPLLSLLPPDALTNRDLARICVLGRLGPGVPLTQAHADLKVIAERLARTPAERRLVLPLDRGMKFMEIPLNHEALTVLAPLTLGFLMVLLIACTNVANLLLARGVTRQQEIAVRLTLGASRGRIVRQLLTENLLLCALAALLGLALAQWTLSGALALLPDTWGGAGEMRNWRLLPLAIDHRVLGFTALLAGLTTLAAGLLPALQSSRTDVISAARDAGSVFGRRVTPRRVRNALVIVQVTVCVLLLSCAGLLGRNMIELRRLDLGYDARGVFEMMLHSPALQARDPGARHVAQREALETLRTLPGVAAATRMAAPTFVSRAGGGMPASVSTHDGPAAGAPQEARFTLIATDFFETLGLPLMLGRTFTGDEVERGAPVAVLNEAAARRFWPGASALGRTVSISENAFHWPSRNAPSPAVRECRVVGVVATTRNAMRKPEGPAIYLPMGASTDQSRVLLRPRNEGPTVLAGITQAAERSGLGLQFGDRLSARAEEMLAPFVLIAWISGALGALALAMAAVGLYGVMAFAVNQRVREIGIRVALGATGENIIRLFVRQGMGLVAIGAVVGLAGGGILALALRKLTLGLDGAFDAMAFGAVTSLLGAVALLACWLPARRATKVDPMVALRAE